MSYFDSRVGECPVWQVVSIRVVKGGPKPDIVVFMACTKIGQFSAEVELTSMLLHFDLFARKIENLQDNCVLDV